MPNIPKFDPANPADVPFPGPRDWTPAPQLELPDRRFDSLLAFLAPSPQGRSRHTSVVIRNTTLAERNAVIVCAGAQFIYEDRKLVPTPPGGAGGVGGVGAAGANGFDPYGLHLDYMSGPTDVEVFSGNATVFRSTDPRRSVIEVRVAIRVRFGFDGRPPFHTADFIAYYNPSDEFKAADPDTFATVGDVFFDFRTKEWISPPKRGAPLKLPNVGAASPLGYFELVKSSAR